MKRLFILLSILAITTPSYACGCGVSEEVSWLLFMSFVAPPIIGGFIGKKGQRLIIFRKLLRIWLTWLFSSALGFTVITNLWPNNVLSDIIFHGWGTTFLKIFTLWIFIPTFLLLTYAYRISNKINIQEVTSQIKENENE